MRTVENGSAGRSPDGPHSRTERGAAIAGYRGRGRRHVLETETGACIGDFQLDAIFRAAGRNADLASLAPRGDGMLDAVLNQRLERKRRHLEGLQLRRNVDRITQAVAEASLSMAR